MLKPIITSDNSHTFYNEATGEHYHSTFGAITESEHIFIGAGLDYINHNNQKLCVLEIGFGTGLNALLSYKYAINKNIEIEYFSVEAFPLKKEEAELLNYPEILNTSKKEFLHLHTNTEDLIELTKNFSLQKRFDKFENIDLPPSKFDVVFFDAFSPESQPELWTADIFAKIYHSMKSGSILTTYSCKGIVKRALKSVGFQIVKIPGPPGKREFLRAKKVDDLK